MHVLIAGITGCGKTTYGVDLVRVYKEKLGMESIVLDPIGDARWKQNGAALVFEDADKFVKAVNKSQNCMLFIDESGEMIGQYNKEMFFLATRARHMGHISHFMVQRPAQVSPTIRDQCTTLILFCVSSKDSKVMADEFPKAANEILSAPAFDKGQYVVASKFGPPVTGRLTFGDRKN